MKDQHIPHWRISYLPQLSTSQDVGLSDKQLCQERQSTHPCSPFKWSPKREIKRCPWFMAALCPLYCMCDWAESELVGCQTFLGSAGVTDFPVQFLPMCITLTFQRTGNSLPAVAWPYEGGFIIMINLHLSGLLVMRVESSFGEGGLVRKGGYLWLRPSSSSSSSSSLGHGEMRGDGHRLVRRRKEERAISDPSLSFFTVPHVRRWWIMEELWAYQLFRPTRRRKG